MTDPKIIVALDYPDAAAAQQLVARLDPALCRLKVGKELFTAEGPGFVSSLVDQGYGVFLDLKFHDIPNTVAKACAAASRLGVWMLNVHASGGRAMMNAAREAVEQAAKPPMLIAVTVLTSMNEATLHELGVSSPLQEHVLRLASLTQACGLDGVVCSAQEAPLLRTKLGQDFCLVTPGIRPADASLDDQNRVLTPAAALLQGSSYLVIGRPITKAADPLAALRSITEEIKGL
ncbi:orotidine-5'-phosphate decarboxylase [Novimethylophilus kurashikiensis]|uniref:Orotidine 5'-phosphate decarboxylase n=1 Tax=Novimethylophilus kurashikiensis TaxID=1825523 RepID=A0A2R5F7Q4_9PROT|nr:orotidine-5'-phosphate decarboxylase [Novimethylophilus kurashikiensis]GBG12711.1 orotidine-5'-phosphate decarboxylase [Novimethylophilus kurashikiensis]